MVIVIGACSICGGDVTVSGVIHKMISSKPQCSGCGALAKPNKPVIPMEEPEEPIVRDARDSDSAWKDSDYAWKSTDNSQYTCNVCGGRFSNGHYCIGKKPCNGRFIR